MQKKRAYQSNNNRRSKYRTNELWHTTRERVIKRDKGQCKGCGRQTTKAQVHHIKPRRQGGSNRLSNLVTLCGGCHMTISPVPAFALRRAFGIRKSDIPEARRRIHSRISQFQQRQKRSIKEVSGTKTYSRN